MHTHAYGTGCSSPWDELRISVNRLARVGVPFCQKCVCPSKNLEIEIKRHAELISGVAAGGLPRSWLNTGVVDFPVVPGWPETNLYDASTVRVYILVATRAEKNLKTACSVLRATTGTCGPSLRMQNRFPNVLPVCFLNARTRFSKKPM
eukprot:6192395-Pleurochrysis_carterae.AAC.2